jgi:RNA polymerase sigma factor (sigma-70 family)
MTELPPFQALIDAHGRDMHRFLIASVGPVDADDCYQEALLSALRAYPKLRDASNLRSWLFTIAHHKVIDHARARTRRPVPVAEVAEVAVGGGGALVEDPEPRVGEDIWTAVGRLPNKQRTAVGLRFIADAPYAEIGAVMETTEEAARRSVHEGLKRLRKDGFQ